MDRPTSIRCAGFAFSKNRRVNVWYNCADGDPAADEGRPRIRLPPPFSDLRFIASVGEALNPESDCAGAREAFGRPIHDNWWQSETGGIMVAMRRPGTSSLARWAARCRVVAHVVRHVEGEPVTLIETPDTVGELALETGWPSMFRGYLGSRRASPRLFCRQALPHQRPGPARCRWLLLVRWPQRRRDRSSNHLIGAFEVGVLIDTGEWPGGRHRQAGCAGRQVIRPSSSSSTWQCAIAGPRQRRLGAAVAAFILALPAGWNDDGKDD